MKILMAVSEAVPYVKVGGLGDVTGALARELALLGHQVVIVLPAYSQIDYDKHGFSTRFDRLGVWTGMGTRWCRLLHRVDADGIDVYLIEHHEYFSRPGIYDEGGSGYSDNGERFAFFAAAVLQVCRDVDFSPDVIHAHDWPGGLLPAMLKAQAGDDPLLAHTGSVLTLHNMAHQGICPNHVFDMAALPESLWDPLYFEDFGRINMLKGGIGTADILTTVSPTYAREILDPIGGMGLHEALRRREHDLHGILNGVDYTSWSPDVDRHLPARYSQDDLTGKWVCKASLQEEFGLDRDPDAPLFGIVARLTGQKGFDLVMAGLDSLVNAGGQLALLGAGEPLLERFFREAPARWRGRVGTWIGFSEGMAHRIEAGADFFLMPSLFEPCGLNQMYSLRYGTIPIVRAVGGLEDTVEAYNLQTGQGTGYKFREPTREALLEACALAMDTWRRRRPHHLDMVRRGMARSFTWTESAQRYVEVYGWAVAKRKHWRSLP